MTPTPTLITSALAGAFTGLVMPILWARLGDNSTGLVVAFLLVGVLPAHAFVMGFGRHPTPAGRTVDRALLKRVGAWLLAAVVVATATSRALPA